MAGEKGETQLKSSSNGKNSSAGIRNYLVFYNVLQFVGWSAVLVTGRLDYLTWFQTIQLIEVLHCVVGFVKSSAVQTFMQILSRIIIVWLALIPFPETRVILGHQLILIAWPLAETTRYLYYALNLLQLNLYIVTWARYTLFIVLYPLGVSGELLILNKLIQIVSKTGVYDYTLPNKLNISFQANVAIILLMLSYIPFFPQLYFYMLSQRKKFLGGRSQQAGQADSAPAKPHKVQDQRHKSD